jgi:hypothetical protein
MDGVSPQTVLSGSRAWSALGFVLTFVPAVVALMVGLDGPPAGGGVAGALLLVGGGLFLLVNALDSLARTIRPNRFRLDPEGFDFETWRGTRRWRWRAYRGLSGIGHQLLRVETATGSIDRVQIGNFPPDLECRLHDHASAHNEALTAPAGPRPSAAPLLVTSGALVALAFLVAGVAAFR